MKDQATEIWKKMQKQMLNSIPENERENFRKLGEKFHSSFDITTGNTRDLSTIDLEESLAYVVESLKSGLHPSYLTEDEIAMIVAGYGDEWYKKWGYTKDDLTRLKNEE